MPQYSRVLALGDSETFGARSTHGRTYPQYLEDRLNEMHPQVPAIVLNRGINGQTSWQIVDRGVDYLLADEWLRIVCCMMGTNDSKPRFRTPIDDYIAQWERLHRACVCTDTLLFPLEIHGIHPIGQPEYDHESIEHIKRMNDALHSWAGRHHLTVVDKLFDPFIDDPAMLADGIHPTNDANQYIAQRVAETIWHVPPYES